MATKTDKITDKVLERLTKAWLQFLFTGTSNFVQKCTGDWLERDRRKQKALLKQLSERRYIEKVTDDGFDVTEKAFKINCSEAEFSLCQIWETRYNESKGRTTRFMPLVPVEIGHDDRGRGFTAGQAKMLWQHRDLYDWGVAEGSPCGHDYYYYNPQPNQPVDPHERGACRQWHQVGDFKSAVERLKTLAEQLHRGAVRDNYPVLIVYNDPLMSCIRSTVVEAHVEGMLCRNLAWGLQKLGICTEEELDYVRLGQNYRRIYAEQGCGLGIRDSLGNLGEDPDKWQEVLADHVEDGFEQIQHLTSQLDWLTKFRMRMDNYGWTKFRDDLATELRVVFMKGFDAEYRGEPKEIYDD